MNEDIYDSYENIFPTIYTYTIKQRSNDSKLSNIMANRLILKVKKTKKQNSNNYILDWSVMMWSILRFTSPTVVTKYSIIFFSSLISLLSSSSIFPFCNKTFQYRKLIYIIHEFILCNRISTDTFIINSNIEMIVKNLVGKLSLFD